MSRGVVLGGRLRFWASCWSWLLLATLGGTVIAQEPSDEPNGRTSVTSSDDGAREKKTLEVAFVTNQIANFWNIAKAGCEDAEAELSDEIGRAHV